MISFELDEVPPEVQEVRECEQAATDLRRELVVAAATRDALEAAGEAAEKLAKWTGNSADRLSLYMQEGWKALRALEQRIEEIRAMQPKEDKI